MSSTTNPTPNNQGAGGATRLLREVAAGQRPTTPLTDLSDLGRPEAREVAALWPGVPVEGRRYLVAQMVAQGEADLDLSFARVLWIALTDPDPDVRSLAIAGLWEDESVEFLDYLLGALASETDPLVREAIVTALGRFNYLLNADALAPDREVLVRDALLACVRSNDPVPVRRRALEGVAYSTFDATIEACIIEAYRSPDRQLQLGALCAMGRTLDPRWLPTILDQMEDPDPEFRYEAVRAAGDLGDPDVIEQVVERLADEDDEVVEAAIEALGAIGGKRAVAVLRELVRSGDEELQPLARAALSEALYESDPFRPDLS